MSTYVNITSPDFNPTVDCAIGTCPIHFAEVQYVPTLAGNSLFLAIFGLFLLYHVIIAFVYRTWSYNSAMACGLILEVIGYVARLQMHENPFKANPFIIYLVTLTVAPAFFTAAIYLCFSRIIIYYGADIARFSTKVYTIVFVISDLIALILQAAGGAIADDADTQEEQDHGVNIMVAGLAWQVFSLTVFTLICVDYHLRTNRALREGRSMGSASNDLRRRMRIFLIAMGLSAFFIFVRSVFRCAELSNGFNSPIANDEISYMILEGTMMVLATGLLTFVHPGLVFRGTWANSGWTFRKSKATSNGGNSGATELRMFTAAKY